MIYPDSFITNTTWVYRVVTSRFIKIMHQLTSKKITNYSVKQQLLYPTVFVHSSKMYAVSMQFLLIFYTNHSLQGRSH